MEDTYIQQMTKQILRQATELARQGAATAAAIKERDAFDLAATMWTSESRAMAPLHLESAHLHFWLGSDAQHVYHLLSAITRLLLPEAPIDEILDLIVREAQARNDPCWSEGALRCLLSRLAPDDPARLPRLRALAQAHQAQGQDEDAEDLLCLAVDEGRRLLGAEHPEVIEADVQLITFLRQRGRHADALGMAIRLAEEDRRRSSSELQDAPAALRLDALQRLQDQLDGLFDLLFSAVHFGAGNHPAASGEAMRELVRHLRRIKETEDLLLPAPTEQAEQEAIGAELFLPETDPAEIGYVPQPRHARQTALLSLWVRERHASILEFARYHPLVQIQHPAGAQTIALPAHYGVFLSQDPNDGAAIRFLDLGPAEQIDAAFPPVTPPVGGREPDASPTPAWH